MKIKLFDDSLLPHNDICPFINVGTDHWSRYEENPDVVVGIGNYGINQVRNYKGSAKKAIIILEPSAINGEAYLYASQYISEFDYVFSHQLFMKDKIPTDKFVYLPFGGTHLNENDIKFHEKTNLVNFILSNKMWSGGHRHRHSVYNEVKHLVEGKGSGATGVHAPYKGDILRNFAFSVAMENEKSDDFFTEKIIDCFLSGTVPIYYGTDNIGNYFNMDGIIKFETSEELLEILPTLSFDKYESMRIALEDNFNRAQNFIFLSKAIYNFFSTK